MFHFTKVLNLKLFQLSFIFVLALLINYNVLYNQYAIDDGIAYTDNRFVKKGIAGIKEVLTEPYFKGGSANYNPMNNDLPGDRWRPLFLLFMTLEQEYIGYAPIYGHLISLVLFFINLIVLYYFLRMFVFSKQKILAFLAVILFTLMPIHSEVIANIKSQDELIAFTFSVLSIIYALKFGLNEKKYWLLFVSFLFYSLSIFTKESAATFFFIIPLSMYFFTETKIWTSIKIGFIYFVIFGFYMFLRFEVTGIDFEAAELLYNDPYLYASFEQKYSTILYVIIYNLQLLVWPIKFSWDYQYNIFPYQYFFELKTLLSLALLLFFAIVSLVLLKKKSLLSYGIIFFFACFILVSNVVVNLGSYLDERCLYLPSIGYVIFASYLVYLLIDKFNKNKFFIGVLGVLFFVYSTRSVLKARVRNSDWHDSISLMRKDAYSFPKNGKLQGSLGDIFLQDYVNSNYVYPTFLVDSAKIHYASALQINPSDIPSDLALAAIYDFQHPNSDSISILYKKNGFITSNGARNVGIKLTSIAHKFKEEGKFNQADSCFKFANNIYPFDPDIVGPYALFLYEQKDYINAEFYAKKAYDLNPTNFQFLKLLEKSYLKVDSIDNPLEVNEYIKKIKKLQDGDVDDILKQFK